MLSNVQSPLQNVSWLGLTQNKCLITIFVWLVWIVHFQCGPFPWKLLSFHPVTVLCVGQRQLRSMEWTCYWAHLEQSIITWLAPLNILLIIGKVEERQDDFESVHRHQFSKSRCRCWPKLCPVILNPWFMYQAHAQMEWQEGFHFRDSYIIPFMKPWTSVHVRLNTDEHTDLSPLLWDSRNRQSERGTKNL